MRRIVLIAGLLGSCGAPNPRAATAPSAEPEAPMEAGWAVRWERSLGWGSSAPLFSPDGRRIISAGAWFDRRGRFVGHAPGHIPGGEMVADLRALLPGGLALVSAVQGENTERLLLVADVAPPGKARASADIRVEAIDVDARAGRVAVHTGSEVRILALPSLALIERIALAKQTIWHDAAVSLHASGALAYVAPAQGCGRRCDGRALVVRSDGRERRLLNGNVEAVAFSRSGDAAAVWTSEGRIEILRLPDGRALGGFAAGKWNGGGGLAVADGGATVAVLACARLEVLARSDTTAAYVPHYEGRVRAVEGRDGCAHVSGLSFSPDGKQLAVAGRNLTLLARGNALPRPAIARYAPRLPAGFRAIGASSSPTAYPHGSGLALLPRMVRRYQAFGGRVEVRVVARDATQLAGRHDLDRWARAVMGRFEPLLRRNRIEELGREMLPYRKAFIDERGRRNLEYALFLHDGCDPHDRYVRYVEDGSQLLEITIQTAPGESAGRVKRWLSAFFDVPVGSAADKRVLATKTGRMHGC